MSKNMNMSRRVAIIGAGASGLTSIKCCLDEGLEPVCFESSDDIGGLWRFKENPEPDRASIYHSLIINTSKEMMCFSDYPIPGHYPNYMHNSFIMDYFRSYADHFNLLRYIRLKTKVLHIKQRTDFTRSGKWDVEIENKDGQKEKHIFDAVLICIGHHCNPHLPLQDFPGIETFTGTNKRAVVIGIGNSGGDIAVELSRFTKQVYLSTRRGAWILNRVGNYGMPLDLFFNRILTFFRYTLPSGLYNSLAEKKLNQRFNHSLYNLKPKHRLSSQHPTVNDDLPNRILSGTVQVKPNIRRIQGSSIEFEDGSVVENIDLVVFATGYTFSYPFLASQVVSVTNNKASLFKYVFPPELDKPTLAIIGLVQPLGAIMPISEMQARWATRVFKGVVKLPSPSAMLQDIKYKEEAMAKRYVASPRHTIQVDYVNYMDEIAKQFGVMPSFLRLLLTDPSLWSNVLFGPVTPYQYRLKGPGKWAGARKAILTQMDRVIEPMQTRPCNDPKPQRASRWLLIVTAALGWALYVNRTSVLPLLQDPSALLDKMKSVLFRQ
uniref:Flavin-containing monooxygenase n=2 Tax=Neogobius melanostomus TaxID=47308 RepID=A0A8C6T951_9GOBI